MIFFKHASCPVTVVLLYSVMFKMRRLVSYLNLLIGRNLLDISNSMACLCLDPWFNCGYNGVVNVKHTCEGGILWYIVALWCIVVYCSIFWCIVVYCGVLWCTCIVVCIVVCCLFNMVLLCGLFCFRFTMLLLPRYHCSVKSRTSRSIG